MVEGGVMAPSVIGLWRRSQTSTLLPMSWGRALSLIPLLTKRRTPGTGDEAVLAQEFIHGEVSRYC